MKKIVLLVSLSVIVVLGIALLLTSQNDTTPNDVDTRLSEEEIREKFRCDRITTDELATDIYCQNPEYYYEDARDGTVIDSSDFNDPRYKAMHKD